MFQKCWVETGGSSIHHSVKSSHSKNFSIIDSPLKLSNVDENVTKYNETQCLSVCSCMELVRRGRWESAPINHWKSKKLAESAKLMVCSWLEWLTIRFDALFAQSSQLKNALPVPGQLLSQTTCKTSVYAPQAEFLAQTASQNSVSTPHHSAVLSSSKSFPG